VSHELATTITEVEEFICLGDGGNIRVFIAIRLPTDANVYFVKNLFPLFLPYMFRPLISPSSGMSQAVFIYNHLVHVVFMLLICTTTNQSTGTRK